MIGEITVTLSGDEALNFNDRVGSRVRVDRFPNLAVGPGANSAVPLDVEPKGSRLRAEGREPDPRHDRVTLRVTSLRL